MKTIEIKTLDWTFRWAGATYICAWKRERDSEHVPDEVIEWPPSFTRAHAGSDEVRIVAERWLRERRLQSPQVQRAAQIILRARELCDAEGNDWNIAVIDGHSLHYIEQAQLDVEMRERMTHDPEEGGPRDRSIGPHPRFVEMDEQRERLLRGTDPQRTPRGWQQSDS